jgi:hypothetical protein
MGLDQDRRICELPVDEADVTESAMFGFNGRELVVGVRPER